MQFGTAKAQNEKHSGVEYRNIATPLREINSGKYAGCTSLTNKYPRFALNSKQLFIVFALLVAADFDANSSFIQSSRDTFFFSLSLSTHHIFYIKFN